MSEVWIVYKAYDTILQSEVLATIAAQSNDNWWQYRYECACCGEEVSLAAQYSEKMVAHFRHRSGNNEVECEAYLGKYSELISGSNSKSNSREKIDFYFESVSHSFCLGIRFSEHEIKKCEESEARLEISANMAEKPFECLSINSRVFAPDDPVFIPLTKYSSIYFILNTRTSEKREHRLFGNKNQPIFFKIQGDEDCFRAKLVRSKELFTSTRYYMVYQKSDLLPMVVRNYEEITISEKTQFKTMDKDFYGVIISVEKESDYSRRLINSFGYKLKASKAFTILWPPTRLLNEEHAILANEAYVYSTLDLRAHENISLRASEVRIISDSVYKLSVESTARVAQENVDLKISRDDLAEEAPLQRLPLQETCDWFEVDEGGSYYLFNKSGVHQLRIGETVFLGAGNEIRCYVHGYLVKLIRPSAPSKISIEDEIQNILKYYKCTESFNAEIYDYVEYCEPITRYIDSCRESGLINKAVGRYILEDR